MGDKLIWSVESLENGKVYGLFSSKYEAIDALVHWSESGLHKYKILDDVSKFKPFDGKPETVSIKFEEDDMHVLMGIRFNHLNNGASLIQIHWQHKELNEEKKRS